MYYNCHLLLDGPAGLHWGTAVQDLHDVFYSTGPVSRFLQGCNKLSKLEGTKDQVDNPAAGG